MSVLEAILYGLLQGVAEFLPISSSGHLALAHNLFGASGVETLAFDVLLHLATLLAVVIVYRKDVWELLLGFFRLVSRLFSKQTRAQALSYGEKLFCMLCISALPLIPIALLSDRVEALGDSTLIIGCLLVCNGGMLWFADRLQAGTLPMENMGLLRPLVIGCLQMFGTLPGISRSGSTITGGRLCGLTREDAVKFSFLMSMPAILGACVLKLPAFFKGGIEPGQALPCAVGAAVALSVGLGAIKLLQFFSRKKGFLPFAIYTVLIGLVAILLSFIL